MIPADQVKAKMNEAGACGIPFLFGINFELTEGFFYKYPQQQNEILWKIHDVSNFPHTEITPSHDVSDTSGFQRHPISMQEYRKKFDIVQESLLRGDSFLLNLTITTEVKTPLTLEEILRKSTSPYRLLLPGHFICFSPETFIRITNGEIFSYPMKGTIRASVPQARETILNDYKEKTEHYTITDLIRNDLNRIAEDVCVKRFRYIDCLNTSNGEILQVSSEISGKLPENYKSQLGNMIFDLLPAGSISGAPKASTLDIIARAEQQSRGFYTGVFGYFDGDNLDSAVMIRFIEQRGKQLFFHSGGGITINSRCEDEYQEALEKVYLPFN